MSPIIAIQRSKLPAMPGPVEAKSEHHCHQRHKIFLLHFQQLLHDPLPTVLLNCLELIIALLYLTVDSEKGETLLTVLC